MEKEIKVKVNNDIFGGDGDFVDGILTYYVNKLTKQIDPYVRQSKKGSPGKVANFSSFRPDMKYNSKILSVEDAIKLFKGQGELNDKK